MPRIFVALPLPPDVASALAASVPAHRALRTVDPALLHVTLAFVGTLPEERVGDVTRAISAAARGRRAFSVPIDEIGRFPPGGRPSVLWAGTSDAAAAAGIMELGAAIRAALARHGIAFDAKPLRPHVTLARVRDGATEGDLRAIRDAHAHAALPGRLAFDARSVHVMESVLGPKGPRYTSRAEAPLA